jgi:hypothetical protein
MDSYEIQVSQVQREVMEHRWGYRREINRVVNLETRSGLAARGRITNVSISGAFIASLLQVRLFSYVTIHFTALQNHKRDRLAVEGQVVRKDSTGFAIEWSEFAPEAVRALANRPMDLPAAVYR